MKRSEAKEELKAYLLLMKTSDDVNNYLINAIFDFMENQIGMLPPTQANKIVYDDKGPKHNESTRQWDDE